MENDFTAAIDQSLKEQFHAICFNPERKDMLQRFTRQHQIYTSHLNTSFSDKTANPQELISN